SQFWTQLSPVPIPLEVAHLKSYGTQGVILHRSMIAQPCVAVALPDRGLESRVHAITRTGSFLPIGSPSSGRSQSLGSSSAPFRVASVSFLDAYACTESSYRDSPRLLRAPPANVPSIRCE